MNRAVARIPKRVQSSDLASSNLDVEEPEFRAKLSRLNVSLGCQREDDPRFRFWASAHLPRESDEFEGVFHCSQVRLGWLKRNDCHVGEHRNRMRRLSPTPRTIGDDHIMGLVEFIPGLSNRFDVRGDGDRNQWFGRLHPSSGGLLLVGVEESHVDAAVM